MIIPRKSKIVNVLHELNFEVVDIKLKKGYWWIGHKIYGCDDLVYFLVKDDGHDFQQLMWQFLGYKISEKTG